MCGRARYLRVTDPSAISLADPISSTRWVHESSLLAAGFDLEPQQPNMSRH